MICNSKSIILALALNASAVDINLMVKPDKVGREGKDALKAGEKGGKEVRIVEDDGLDDLSKAFSEMFPDYPDDGLDVSVGKDGKDALKAGEKVGKEVSIVEDDGLDDVSKAFSEMFPDAIEDAGRTPGEVFDMNFYTPETVYENPTVVMGNGPNGLLEAMSD